MSHPARPYDGDFLPEHVTQDRAIGALLRRLAAVEAEVSRLKAKVNYLELVTPV